MGTAIAINSYDDHGIPGLANQGRFGYTGQTFLGDLGMNYYKARMYSPTMGRFMQTDPIGYADGLNMYAYVGGDPVNRTDPSGLAMFCRVEYKLSNSYDMSQGPSMMSSTTCTGSIDPPVISNVPQPPGGVGQQNNAGNKKSGKKSSPCDSDLHRLGDALELGGDTISASGILLAVTGELIMPVGGGAGGGYIAETGGLMSTAGQIAQDIAFKRPPIEIIGRAAANAFGSKALVGGIQRLNHLTKNKLAEAVGDYAAGKYLKVITDALDPNRCPAK